MRIPLAICSPPPSPLSLSLSLSDGRARALYFYSVYTYFVPQPFAVRYIHDNSHYFSLSGIPELETLNGKVVQKSYQPLHLIVNC